MREQVITPRANGRGAQAGGAGRGRSGGVTQKPARRSPSTRASNGGTLRAVLAYLPLVGKVLLAIVAGVLIFAGYRAAASASFFEARSVDISGVSRASADEIKAVVRRATMQTGVWRADLDTISAEVEKLPWVRKAVVSRVLPDGLRVRVTERAPRAVVRTNAGKFIWVDEDAVSLGQMSPSDQMPSFFIRGWDEASTEPARMENRDRIQRYLEMSREWESMGLSERVSEVNLGDLRDVRAQLAGDDSEIEVQLGGGQMSDGLRRALIALDDQRNTSCGPFIIHLVVRPKNIITGFRPDMFPACKSASMAKSSEAEIEQTNQSLPVIEQQPKRIERKATAKDTTPRKQSAEKKKEPVKKEKPAVEVKKETRPRRVG